MIRMLNATRFAQMVEVVESSVKPMQLKHRKKLLVQLFRFLEECGEKKLTDAEMYVRLWQNPPLWVLSFINDEQGRPMFLSPWQCRFWAVFENKRRLMGLMTRKAGKSTVLAAMLTWSLCSPKPIRSVAFSPSEGQSFIYDKCRIYVSQSPYLNDTFMRGKDAKNTDDEMRSNVGSVVAKGYVSQNTRGEQARGQYGDIIVVDEVQSISKSILDEIIEPMVADAYSEDGSKKLVYIGTPHTKSNPELPEMWSRYNKKQLLTDEYGIFTIDCWGAVNEGCIDETYVKEQEATMHPDVFAREYLAIFPDDSDGFLSRAQMKACVKSDLSFQVPRPNSGREYAMATDWAKHNDRTQIVIAEIDMGRNEMVPVAWKEIDPKDASDYTKQAEEALRMFNAWRCKYYVPDSAGTQDMILDFMRKGVNGQPGIPDYKIFGYDPKVKFDKQRLGYKATGDRNYSMYMNFKYLIQNKQIHLPSKGRAEKLFCERLIKEATSMITIETANGIKFEKPKGGHKDLLSAMCMLSLLITAKKFERPSFKVASFGRKRRPLSGGR